MAQEIRRADAVGDEAAGQLGEENSKLKRIVADLSLDKAMLQEVLAILTPGRKLALVDKV